MALQTKTFTYGATNSAASKYYKTELTLTEASINIADNTSVVEYSLILYAGNTSFSEYRTGAKVFLNGAEVAHRDGTPYSSQISVSAWGNVVLLEGSTTVKHGSDGKLNMSVSFEVYHPFTPDNRSPGNFTFTGGSMELTVIPRHSTVAATSGNIGETVNLTVTRQSESFYHSLRYKHPANGAYYYLDAEGNSVAEEILHSSTTVPFKIPLAFAYYLNGKTSGSITFECWTFTENDLTKYIRPSKSAEFTFYPLPSSVAATSGEIGKTVNLTVTRQCTNFYHSLRYKHPSTGAWCYLDANGNSVAEEILLSSTTVPFKVPNLYSQIPDSKSGTLTFECWTFPGYNKTVYLSQKKTAQFTYWVNAGESMPTVSATLKDVDSTVVAVTGDDQVLVRYASNPQITVTAEAKNGATIKDASKDVALEYTGKWLYDGDLVFDIANVEQGTFQLWTRDSRGYDKYGSVSAKKFVPYVQLTNNAYAKRDNQTGSDATVYLTGSFYAGKINEAQNVLKIWIKPAGSELWIPITEDTDGVSWNIDSENHTYAVSVPLSGIEYTNSLSVETCVRDLFGDVNGNYDVYKTVVIPAGRPVFDWGKEGFRFNVPVDMPSLSINGVEPDLIVESGTENGWTIRKWKSGVAECWKTLTGAVACTRAWGGLFYGTIPEINFPSNLFVNTPTLSTTLDNPNMFLAKYGPTATTTGNVFAISALAIETESNYTLHYMAKGRWE